MEAGRSVQIQAVPHTQNHHAKGGIMAERLDEKNENPPVDSRSKQEYNPVLINYSLQTVTVQN